MTGAGLYVDGYNLYHGIDDLTKTTQPHASYLKWLSLRALGEEIVRLDHKLHKLSAVPILNSVDYFSAWATHRDIRYRGQQSAYAKQQIYVDALKATRVDPHMGHFTKTKLTCKKRVGTGTCGHTWVRHEEKKSDVAIALKLLEDTVDKKFDTFYLISGDTDLVPVLEAFKRRAQGTSRRIVSISPPGPGRKVPESMKAIAHAHILLRRENIEACLLPRILYDQHGNAIRRPRDYDPPAPPPGGGNIATVLPPQP